MDCWKCHGLVVKEWMSDELDEAFVWRCLNCGSLTDEIIQRNQKGVALEKRQTML